MHVCVCACVFLRKSEETPLHLCCEEGHLAVATLLLDRGADVNPADIVSEPCTHTLTEGTEESTLFNLGVHTRTFTRTLSAYRLSPYRMISAGWSSPLLINLI